MKEVKLPPALQQQILQLQQLQEQLQVIVNQRMQLELQIKDTENAIKEVEALDENAEIYKSIGGILVKTTKNKVLEELKEKKELLDIRLKSLQKQEEKLQIKLKEMEQKVQEGLRSLGATG